MAPKLSWLLTSRTGNFVVLASGLLGYGLYDRAEAENVRKTLQSRVAHLALEPLAPADAPRRLTLFLPSTQWADYWFKEFAKPGTAVVNVVHLMDQSLTHWEKVLDAAALDYELVKIAEPQDLEAKTQSLLWEAKAAWTESLARPLPRRTWFQWVRGATPVLDEASYGPDYRPEEGMVALSEPLWHSLQRGLEKGSLGSRPSPVVAPAPIIPDAAPTSEAASPLENSDASLASDSPKESALPPNKEDAPVSDDVAVSLSPDNLPRGFPLPPLGFLPGDKELPFRTRIYGFFHRRHTTQEVGEAAVRIALGQTKAAKDCISEESVNGKDLNPDLASRVRFYV